MHLGPHRRQAGRRDTELSRVCGGQVEVVATVLLRCERRLLEPPQERREGGAGRSGRRGVRVQPLSVPRPIGPRRAVVLLQVVHCDRRGAWSDPPQPSCTVEVVVPLRPRHVCDSQVETALPNPVPDGAIARCGGEGGGAAGTPSSGAVACPPVLGAASLHEAARVAARVKHRACNLGGLHVQRAGGEGCGGPGVALSWLPARPVTPNG
mmetsp:Transcript_33892/g.106568  ORF Transcript_33892/g.106568 Transcript_33892/m.106568 type:complete len:209 (+) Transcript_33892:730-1356(+)